MSARSIASVVTVLVFAGIADGADWTTLRPQVTTETELIAAFGPPAEVTATFPWTEWNARWKKRPRTSEYVLRYRVQDSASALLIGPAGKADEVEVAVWERRVSAVRWRYGGPSARTAASALRADPRMTFGSPESTSHAGRSVDGGFLLAEIGRNDTQVEIQLSLK
jgi:hypothetical protein